MTQSEDIIPAVKPDLPAPEDLLGFQPYAQTLFDIICDPDTQTPLTIGIFGSWGSGKTSLMTMIREHLDTLRKKEKQRAKEGESVRLHLPVWFNAWLYSSESSLGRALILRVLAELRREVGRDREARQALDKVENNLRRTGELSSLGQLVIGGQDLVSGSGESAQFHLSLTTGLSLLDQIARARTEAAELGDADQAQAAVTALMDTVEQMQATLDRQRVEALEIFRQDFGQLVEKYISPGVLVVFVDDLDRCLPDKAVEVLEAIKLFFEIEGCIFVLGIDRDVVERGIRLKYRDYEQLEGAGPPPIDGAKYLEKIVQIPFQLPPIDRTAMEGYVGKMSPELVKLDHRCDDVFTVGMEELNPRRVKRTLNIFLLLWRLSRHLEGVKAQIKPVRLAKMVVIQLHHEGLFNLLPSDPSLLIELEKLFREEERRRERDYSEQVKGQAEAPARVATFLGNPGLRDLLTLHAESEQDANFSDMTPAEVLEYVHLSHSAAEAWAVKEGAPMALEPQLVHIPAGDFLMGVPEDQLDGLTALFEGEDLIAEREWLIGQTPQHDLQLPAYDIGRYPITNAEYAAFVRAMGGQFPPPRHWQKGEPPPELARHPVVNVTWQDAVNYCQWLSQQTGKRYRLPNEAEWEKAAGWDIQTQAKYRYPWGDTWEVARCNNKGSGSKGTAPAGQYSQAGGDSAYGVADMAGNVWEWTLSKWGRDRTRPVFRYPYKSQDGREALEGTEFRVLRGGSFYDGPGWCSTSARYPNEPLLSADYIGFRVMRETQEGSRDVVS